MREDQRAEALRLQEEFNCSFRVILPPGELSGISNYVNGYVGRVQIIQKPKAPPPADGVYCNVVDLEGVLPDVHAEWYGEDKSSLTACFFYFSEIQFPPPLELLAMMADKPL